MSTSTDEFEDAISDQESSINKQHPSGHDKMDPPDNPENNFEQEASPASTLNKAESINSTNDSLVSGSTSPKKNKKKNKKKKNKKKSSNNTEEDQDHEDQDLSNLPQLSSNVNAESSPRNESHIQHESQEHNPIQNEEEELTIVVPKPVTKDEQKVIADERPILEDELTGHGASDTTSGNPFVGLSDSPAKPQNHSPQGTEVGSSPHTAELYESDVDQEKTFSVSLDPANSGGPSNKNSPNHQPGSEKSSNNIIDNENYEANDDTEVEQHRSLNPSHNSPDSIQPSPEKLVMVNQNASSQITSPTTTVSPRKPVGSSTGINHAQSPVSTSSSAATSHLVGHQLPDSPTKISNNSPNRNTSPQNTQYSKAYSPIDSPQRSDYQEREFDSGQTLQEPFIARSDNQHIDINHINATEITNEPPLPNRKSIKDCLRLDQPNAIINTSQTEDESVKRLSLVSASYQPNSANFLLESKFNELNREFENKDSKSREHINSGSETIKKTFNDIKNTVGGLSNDFFDYNIDWEFWTRIVNNYESVVRNEGDALNQIIMKGIPKEFRGIVWQLIAKSKNFQLEEFYLQLKNENSVHEKSIKRDLTRTSFFTNIDQIKKTDELFNVIKAYSLFDPDVGYTQGMIFIVVPLIMNMNESECFGLLVTLMKDYKLRSLFCPEMKGLHLLLYEFDRLLEIYSPRLYNHLVKQGIKSSMYASQWFLTFFAYKFPLDIVLRIFDIVITQGIEAILKFSINLMIKNESNLINLKFDKLLEFLKSNLFNVYVNEEFINYDKEGNAVSNNAPGAGGSNSAKRSSAGLSRSGSVSKRFSLLGGNRGSIYGGSNSNKQQKDYYKLDQLVFDAMQINVVPLDLNKFELEFENIYINETSKVEEIEDLRIQNGKLRHDIKLLETEFANVNRDHIGIVQKMVDTKVTLPEVLSDNEELHKQIEKLRADIEDLQSKVVSSPEDESTPSLNSGSVRSSAIPTRIEQNIQELLIVNAQETEKFATLEEEYQQLALEEEKLTSELKVKTAKKWFPWNKA